MIPRKAAEGSRSTKPSEPSQNSGVLYHRMNRSRFRSYGPWLICLAGAVVCGVIIINGLWRQPLLEPMVVVKRPFSPPLTVRDRIESCVPLSRSWAWAHRAIDMIFGRRKTVNFGASAFTFNSANATSQVELDLGAPSFVIRTNGMAVWFLNTAQITSLRERLEAENLGTSFRSRVTTADGFGAEMSAGYDVVLNGITNHVGLQENYFSRIGSRGTDLHVSLLCSEVVTNNLDPFELNQPAVFIRTNADFSVRLQVPNHRGIFLITRDSLAGKSAGIILDPL